MALSLSEVTSSSELILLVFAFLIVSAIRRTYLTYHGARFLPERTVIFAIVYAGVGLAVSLTSFYEGLTALFAPVYALVIAVAVAGSYVYSERRVAFWRHADGSVYFKGGIVVYIVYLAALVVRLLIDYLVIGPNVFTDILTPGYSLAGEALYGTVSSDVLLMFGVGLLLGRSARALYQYRRIKRGEIGIPDSAPPLGSRLGSKS